MWPINKFFNALNSDNREVKSAKARKLIVENKKILNVISQEIDFLNKRLIDIGVAEGDPESLGKLGLANCQQERESILRQLIKLDSQRKVSEEALDKVLELERTLR